MHKREILPNLLTFYLLVNAPNVVLHELEILRDVQAADQANQTKSVATKHELLKSNGPLISISYFKEWTNGCLLLLTSKSNGQTRVEFSISSSEKSGRTSNILLVIC